MTDEREWLYFQGWQVNVFVHENYATGGDGTARTSENRGFAALKTPSVTVFTGTDRRPCKILSYSVLQKAVFCLLKDGRTGIKRASFGT